jgi:hypothetical protein
MKDQDYFCDLTVKEAEKMSEQFRRANVAWTHPFNKLISLLSGKRLPDAALRTKWRLMKSGPFKDCEVCVCCMLRGSLMKNVRCHIYENRPSICRSAVKPGDKNCLELRRILRREEA